MSSYVVYGDFNCPFSALASARVDVIDAGGRHTVAWRAIQHDTAIPTSGELVEGEIAAGLAAEVNRVCDLSALDVELSLVVPPVRPNTALACAAWAGDQSNELRQRLFGAVWAEGRNIGDPAVLKQITSVGCDKARASRWQSEFEALPRPITPSLVLPGGQVSRGLGALARLAELTASTT